MASARPASFGGLLVFFSLCGCGLSVPDIKEIADGPGGTQQIEFEIKKRIYCDLKEAVAETESIPLFIEDRATGKKVRKQILPDDWGAQLSLLLQVDESTTLNPGVAFNNPMENAVLKFPSGDVPIAQSFSLGLGGTFSSTATRIDKFVPYYPIGFLRQAETKASVCRPENDPYIQIKERPAMSSPFIVKSNLGIQKWLAEAMITNSLLHSINPSESPSSDAPDTISLEIKFIIVSSGNITPTWTLVRFVGNNSSPFFSTGRTRTHDLIITIGPSKDTRTANTFLANQIGQAVNSGNRPPIPSQ